MEIDRKQLLLDLMGHETYKPMKIKEIAILLGLTAEEKKGLDPILKALVSEGKVVQTKRGKYMLNDKDDYVVGTYIAHPKGFGFLDIEGEDEDIFIPAIYTGGAFHKDTVAVALLPTSLGKRKEGQIVKILQRGKSQVIGTYEDSATFGFVKPDDKKMRQDIFIAKENSLSAMKGHKVVVEITNWGDEKKKPEGIIKRIIGHIDDPETEILAIVMDMEIPMTFPEEVLKQTEQIPSTVEPKAAEGRLDLRDQLTVTIDGADAKDLDDAITLQKIEGGYRLGVHIADVAHYVAEGSPIDVEALNRSTSVYLVDRVIPMIPRQLSNGICSLNAKVDRLSLSCIMDIDSSGNVGDYQIVESVINVNERMTYHDVAAILDAEHEENEQLTQRYDGCLNMFREMAELAEILRSKRKHRGSIDFNFPEAKVKLDDNGDPVDIYVYDRNVATRIIEEFMLLANETVAENYFWQESPFVYRNHDEPDAERIRALGQFIYNFGYHIKGKEDVHPKEIQKLLIDIEGTTEETLISRLALRSMKQAKYEVHCNGHYGLAAKYYSHFTSPIRRYPDLQIHRIIKEHLQGRMDEDRLEHYKKILPDVTKQNSEYERRAEQAERETIKLKKVQYMERHIGEDFEGVISGVTKWGLYVELPNTIEGLVHVTSMKDDYYIYDEKHYTYTGERTGRTYSLGDVVHVNVEGCNRQERTIDFVLNQGNKG